MSAKTFTLERHHDYWAGCFTAMASPCQILIDNVDEAAAARLTHLAYREAVRIEEKFSRYRRDNIVNRINRSAGAPIEVDTETAALLDFAEQCYEISAGMFDITSGVLRKLWRFDGSDRVPRAAQVENILRFVGWPKVTWRRPYLTLPTGMEIDFGGIGKEYAVDKTAQLLQQQTTTSLLINFGGDLFTTGPRHSGQGWFVGVEDIATTQQTNQSDISARVANIFELQCGAIATSGDTKRFVLKEGIRYGHILDPRTGWPVAGAPHSISVAAATCTDAGILATMAMLNGEGAEKFLQQQQMKFWCLR